MMAVNTQSKARPDLFSRGALELTFRLLRERNAQLALDIQNLLQANKVEPQSLRLISKLDPKSKADHFYVTLSAQSIGLVVKNLTQLGQEMLEQPNRENGKLLVIRTLMKDWMDLTEWIIMQVDPPRNSALETYG